MFVKLICKYESLQTKVRVKSLGGGYSHIKRTGLLVRISERNPKGSTKILFCGRGLKFFHPLEVPILNQNGSTPYKEVKKLPL